MLVLAGVFLTVTLYAEETRFRFHPAALHSWEEGAQWQSFGAGSTRTEWRMECTSEALTLQARMHTPIEAVAVAAVDDVPFEVGEEAVMFRFDPNRSGRNTIFIGFNPGNRKYDGLSYSADYNYVVDSQVAKTSDGWEVRAYIRWEELGMEWNSRLCFGLNLYRQAADGSSAVLAGEWLEPTGYPGYAAVTALPLQPGYRDGKMWLPLPPGSVAELCFDWDGKRCRQSLFEREGGAFFALPPDTLGELPLYVSGRTGAGREFFTPLIAEAYCEWNPDSERGTRFPLNGSTSVWQANSLWKIQPQTPVPAVTADTLLCELAANEYEGVQIVIRPPQTGRWDIEISELRNAAGVLLPVAEDSWFQLGMVPIARASDQLGYRGEWPDPLIPLTDRQIECVAERNTILYWRVHAPPGMAGGTYLGELRLRSDLETMVIPVAITVFDFTLPRDTGMRTAYGAFHHFQEFQRLETPEQRREELRRIIEVLRLYRIEVSNAFDSALPVYREGGYDFTDFDAWGEWLLNECGYRGFNLGFFRLRPTLAWEEFPYEAAELEERRKACGQLLRHLEEKGWREKLYWYDVDEPMPQQYRNAAEYLQMIATLLPGVPRIAVYCHTDRGNELEGSVDTWCPLIDRFQPEYFDSRRQQGEEVWWYVCNFPKAPYPTSFIDAPAIMPRIRFWMAEKYGIAGSLYWAVDYLGTTANGTIRNPWSDPWILNESNGDGMLLYPPCREPSSVAVEESPWPSLRLELIRDGLEDREYFRVGRALLEAAQSAGVSSGEVDTLRTCLEIPESLIRSTTDYQRDPNVLLAQRQALGRAVAAVRSKLSQESCIFRHDN